MLYYLGSLLGNRLSQLMFPLTLCAMGGGPKDPQLSKSLNALKWVHKNCWNVFDFSYIDLKKISNQKF